MEELVKYVVDNFNLIKANLAVFVIGWCIFAGLGFSLSAFISKMFDEKWKQKYEQKEKEYEELEKTYRSLEKDYQLIKAEFSKNDLLVLGSGNNKGKSPLAKTMSEVLNNK